MPTDMFKALSVETRLKIIKLLKTKGPLGVKNIAERIGVTPAAVSQHMKILRLSGLVRFERKGYWIPYSIDEPAMENCRQLLNKICTCRYTKFRKTRKRENKNRRSESLQKIEGHQSTKRR